MRKIAEISKRQREAMEELARLRRREELIQNLTTSKRIADTITKMRTRIAELGWVLETHDGKEEAEEQNTAYRRGWR